MKDLKVAGAIIIGSGLIALAIYFGLTQGLRKDHLTQSEGLTQEPMIIVKETPQKLLEKPGTPSSSIEANQELFPLSSQKPKVRWTKSDLITALSEKTGISENENTPVVGKIFTTANIFFTFLFPALRLNSG